MSAHSGDATSRPRDTRPLPSEATSSTPFQLAWGEAPPIAEKQVFVQAKIDREESIEAIQLAGEQITYYEDRVTDSIAAVETAEERAFEELAATSDPDLFAAYRDASDQEQRLADHLEQLVGESQTSLASDLLARHTDQAHEQGQAPEEDPRYQAWMSQISQHYQEWGEAIRSQRDAHSRAELLRFQLEALVGDQILDHPLVTAALGAESVAGVWADLDQARSTFNAARARSNQLQDAMDQAWGRLEIASGRHGFFTNYIGEAASSQLQALVTHVFGHSLGVRELGRLVLAEPGDQVRVEPKGEEAFRIGLAGPNHHILTFEFHRQADGGVVIKDPGARTTGSRSTRSGNWIIGLFDELERAGVRKIFGRAARSADMNGYITWAELGWVGNIPQIALNDDRQPVQVRRYFQQRFNDPNLTRVEQLMKLPGGPAEWRAHGVSWDAEFDFTPNSHSMRILGALRARRSRQTP